MPRYERIIANMGDYDFRVPASVIEFSDPNETATSVEVAVFIGRDGATVVQIDTHGDDRLRINVNDSTPFDRGVESGIIYRDSED